MIYHLSSDVFFEIEHSEQRGLKLYNNDYVRVKVTLNTDLWNEILWTEILAGYQCSWIYFGISPWLRYFLFLSFLFVFAPSNIMG